MTHEQKPESAEFRTRDVNAWQPISTAPKDGSHIDLWVLGLEEEFRFENAHYGVEQHDCGQSGKYCDSCPASGKRWIDAFGMEIAGTVTHWRAIPASPKVEAEQRRKDAEEAEPCAYRWAYDVPKGRDSLWHFGGDLPEPRPERPEPKHVTPLYTRPVNVAALIAEAVAAERERCAKVCESKFSGTYPNIRDPKAADYMNASWDACCEELAEVIRDGEK